MESVLVAQALNALFAVAVLALVALGLAVVFGLLGVLNLAHGELVMVGAQATRYLPGQFLRLHDDHHAVENRRYAYVVNLSRDWEADWGGMLHFVAADGSVEEVFMPRFNSLSLFRVPHRHFVGLVSPWAKQPRLAITGWWHATPQD